MSIFTGFFETVFYISEEEIIISQRNRGVVTFQEHCRLLTDYVLKLRLGSISSSYRRRC